MADAAWRRRVLAAALGRWRFYAAQHGRDLCASPSEAEGIVSGCAKPAVAGTPPAVASRPELGLGTAAAEGSLVGSSSVSPRVRGRSLSSLLAAATATALLPRRRAATAAAAGSSGPPSGRGVPLAPPARVPPEVQAEFSALHRAQRLRLRALARRALAAWAAALQAERAEHAQWERAGRRRQRTLMARAWRAWGRVVAAADGTASNAGTPAVDLGPAAAAVAQQPNARPTAAAVASRAGAAGPGLGELAPAATSGRCEDAPQAAVPLLTQASLSPSRQHVAGPAQRPAALVAAAVPAAVPLSALSPRREAAGSAAVRGGVSKALRLLGVVLPRAHHQRLLRQTFKTWWVRQARGRVLGRAVVGTFCFQRSASNSLHASRFCATGTA
jgi:hypothetical protein